jgi:hypothetical protein
VRRRPRGEAWALASCASEQASPTQKEEARQLGERPTLEFAGELLPVPLAPGCLLVVAIHDRSAEEAGSDEGFRQGGPVLVQDSLNAWSVEPWSVGVEVLEACFPGCRHSAACTHVGGEIRGRFRPLHPQLRAAVAEITS